MSQRPSTAVSVWTTPASRWPEAAIVINFSTGCAVHATICAARMEQSAWLTAPTVIIGTIQDTLKSHHSVALWCLHCCKDDQLFLWRRAKLGVSELWNPWTDCHKIWHGWLRWRYDPESQNAQWGIRANGWNITFAWFLIFCDHKPQLLLASRD